MKYTTTYKNKLHKNQPDYNEKNIAKLLYKPKTKEQFLKHGPYLSGRNKQVGVVPFIFKQLTQEKFLVSPQYN